MGERVPRLCDFSLVPVFYIGVLFAFTSFHGFWLLYTAFPGYHFAFNSWRCPYALPIMLY